MGEYWNYSERARIAKANLVHLIRKCDWQKAKLEERNWKKYCYLADNPIRVVPAIHRRK